MPERPDLLCRIEALEAELARLKTAWTAASFSTTDAAAPPPEQEASEPASSRRDLLRYGVAALGAVAAGGVAGPAVQAADGNPLIIGGQNNATNTTYVVSEAGFGLSAYALNESGAIGLRGEGSQFGVYGITASPASGAAGVRGVSTTSASQTPGVYGSAASPNAPAVYGRHQGGGNAIRAEVPSFSTANAIALYALNYSSYTGGGPGAGGFAIYGLSANGHGLVGATAAAGGAAVVGASNGVAGAYAAAFYGPVLVGGDFTVFGAKSAAVPHPDGSHRRLYCVESPESWFEDFGRGTLTCGEATVALDPDFAAVADTSEYHVFLTGDDGIFDLCVSNRATEGFRVRAPSADAAGDFSWRVVAKRRDIAGPRLERVEVPTEPALPEVPPSVHEPPPPGPDMARMKSHERKEKP